MARTECPRASSSRTRCPPCFPVAPVTSTFNLPDMSLSSSSRVVSFFEQPLGEHDLDHLRDGLETRPIPLKLARQRHPAYRLSSSKRDTFQTGAMCFDGRAANRVDDGIHLEAFAESVERRKRHTDLSPQSAEDEFPSPGASHRRNERGVFPRVETRPIDRRVALEHRSELWNRGLLPAGRDVDRRMYDRQPERLRDLCRRHHVLQQEVVVHRSNCRHLRRLIVDHDQRRVLRRDEMIGARIAFGSSGHGWTHDAKPRSRRRDSMTQNVVLAVKTSAAASTPVYFLITGAAAASVHASR